MKRVLTRGPWSFGEWMLVVQRWTPNITEEELKIIPFWIQIGGILLQYLTSPMVKSLGEKLGHVENVDFDKATKRVDYVKYTGILVIPYAFNANSSLVMTKTQS